MTPGTGTPGTGNSAAGSAAVSFLELDSVSKSYPGVRALDGVTFTAWPGQVHALVGANGAGKSTLIRIAAGVEQPDAGQLRVQGVPVRLNSPLRARGLGIAVVFQEAELLDTLSLAENLAFLRNWAPGTGSWISWRTMERAAREILLSCQLDWDVRQTAERLTVAQRQLLQLAVAVSSNARLVILDEPTSALSESESHWLFSQIRNLTQRGASVLYVSHRREEVLALADSITVLRDGRNVWTGSPRDTTQADLITRMVGAAASPASDDASVRTQNFARSTTTPRFRAVNLTDDRGRFHAVNLAVAAGEILGIYGLIGAGRTEFAEALYGLRPVATGQIELDGQQVDIESPAAAVALGVGYVPEDRLKQGIFRNLSVRANSVVSSLRRWSRGPWIRPAREVEATAGLVAQLNVALRHLEQPIGQLSGGNQQKIVVGRALLAQPRLLILDEPTRGVDVAAKAELHRILRRLADAGVSILMISSELEEVVENCDRVAVFSEGRVRGCFDPRREGSSPIGAAAFPSGKSPPERDAKLPPDRTQVAARSQPDRPRRYFRSISRLNDLALACLVGVLLVALARSGGGLRLSPWGTGVTMWILLALGAAAPMLVRGIDISLGAVVALSAASSALVLKSALPESLSVPLALLAGPLAGGLCGLLNGLCCQLTRLHPVVVTLGTMTIYRGSVILLLQGKAVTNLPAGYLDLVGGNLLGGPHAVWCGLGTVAGLALWLGTTRQGRSIYATGANPEAARALGIDQRRTWLVAFTLGGMLAGIAGSLNLGHSGQMQAQLGSGWELQAISAAIVGGVSLTGGRGTVAGIVLGALLLRLINSLLVRWGVSEHQFELVAGAILLAAVVGDRTWRQRSAIG